MSIASRNRSTNFCCILVVNNWRCRIMIDNVTVTPDNVSSAGSSNTKSPGFICNIVWQHAYSFEALLVTSGIKVLHCSMQAVICRAKSTLLSVEVSLRDGSSHTFQTADHSVPLRSPMRHPTKTNCGDGVQKVIKGNGIFGLTHGCSWKALKIAHIPLQLEQPGIGGAPILFTLLSVG